MKLPKRKVVTRTLIASVAMVTSLTIAMIATKTDDNQNLLVAEAASGTTNITSIVKNGTLKSYSAKTCYGSVSCDQLQGFTVTNDKLVYYAQQGGVDRGAINAYSGSNFSTQVSGTPFDASYGHGNDMTYNSRDGKVVVIGPNSYKSAYILNGSTLAKESSKTISEAWAIGYDEFHNYYVLLQDKIWLADANFQHKIGMSYSTSGNVSQGMEYHNGHVYWTLSSSDYISGGYIYVYNAKLKTDGTADSKFGEKVATYYIDTSSIGEIESISFRNNKAYLGFAYGTMKFYSFASSNIEIPIETTVKYTDNAHSTKVTITSTEQLESKSGYTLSSDGYSLSKTVNAGSISESTKFCDNYNNCKTLSLSHTNSDYTQQQSQTVSFADSSVTKTYGDAAFTNAATTTGDGAISYSSSNPNIATINSNNGEVTIKAAGTVTITATAAETDDYASASESYTLTINKASQTVSFANTSTDITTEYGDDFTNQAISSSSTATITYASSDTTVATVDLNGKITAKKLGKVTITATATAENYNDGSNSYTLNIVEKTITPDTGKNTNGANGIKSPDTGKNTNEANDIIPIVSYILPSVAAILLIGFGIKTRKKEHRKF